MQINLHLHLLRTKNEFIVKRSISLNDIHCIINSLGNKHYRFCVIIKTINNMETLKKGKVTKVFNYGYTVETEDGIKGTLKIEDIPNFESTHFQIGNQIEVFDSGKRSVKGGVIWSISDGNVMEESVFSGNPLASLFTGSKSREELEQLFSVFVSNLPYIDSENTYELAKQLLSINKSFSPVLCKDFVHTIFLKANKTFKLRLWKEGFVSYCNIYELAKHVNLGNEEIISFLNNKYNLSLSKTSKSDIRILSKGIEDQLVFELSKSSHSIYIAVAWFTNIVLFKEIISALDRGVSVIMVLNNDLINNGGYCLNFNVLINKGARIHLVEYPSHMNNKFCIIDETIIFTGSYNWTLNAEHNNDENCLIVKNDEDVIQAYMKIFIELCQKYDSVDNMPDKVPEKPEYDRSSFKCYISDELATSAKISRSNSERERLYKSALRLRPNNSLIPDSYRQDSSENVRQREAVTRSLHQQEIRRQEGERQAQSLRQIREQLTHESPERETEIKQLTEQIEQIESSIEDTIAEEHALENLGNTSLEGQSGKLRINLKWETTDDLDLHLCLPNGSEIYYSQKEQTVDGFKGYLDVDANAGSPYTTSPQENIYWKDGLPEGQYTVKVVLYCYRSSENKIPFVLTIWPQDLEPIIKTHTIKKLEDRFEITMAKIIYSKSQGFKVI